MIVFLCVVAYIIVIAGFCLWDSLIGMGTTFSNDEMPLAVGAVAWPISIPILLVWNFARLVMYLKEKRVTKEQEEERIRYTKEEAARKLRIKLEREEEAALEDIDRELRQYNKK